MLAYLSAENQKIKDALETVGYASVVILAIWQQQIVQFVKRPKASLQLVRREASFPQAVREKCYHGIVTNTGNADLECAKVLIHRIKVDVKDEVYYVVPYRFCWAPSELRRKSLVVPPRNSEIFDIGIFNFGKVNDTQSEIPYFELNYQPWQGGHVDRLCFHEMRVTLSISAQNLDEDIFYEIHIKVLKDGAILTLKEIGPRKPYFPVDRIQCNC